MSGAPGDRRLIANLVSSSTSQNPTGFGFAHASIRFVSDPNKALYSLVVVNLMLTLKGRKNRL